MVEIPKDPELLYWCDEHGGTCPKTGYMLVRIEAGEMPSQTAAFYAIYESLTGNTWDGNGNSPMVEFHLDSFLKDGYLTDEMPSQGDLWGVMFMRLSENEKEALITA